MTHAISRHTAMLTIHCQGGTTFEIREGDVVDLDEVIGGQTIAAWLGAALLANFEPAGLVPVAVAMAATPGVETTPIEQTPVLDADADAAAIAAAPVATKSARRRAAKE